MDGEFPLTVQPSGSAQSESEWDSNPANASTFRRRWDLGGWGDRRTWAILFASTLFGVALAFAAWAMPHGRDAAVPPIHIY